MQPMDSSPGKDWPVLDSDFQFECTLCGECCRGTMEVYLDLYDLFRIAGFLGFKDTGQLFHQKLVELVPGQHGVFMPRIRFKSKPLPFCPFLINEVIDEKEVIGKCSLHPAAKPLICSIAPVAHEIDLASGDVRYLLVDPVPGCPGMERKRTNLLEDVITLHKKALEHRERFFALLESLKTGNHPEQFFLENIYSFPVEELFIHP